MVNSNPALVNILQANKSCKLLKMDIVYIDGTNQNTYIPTDENSKNNSGLNAIYKKAVEIGNKVENINTTT
jgi:hypothetical protein